MTDDTRKEFRKAFEMMLRLIAVATEPRIVIDERSRFHREPLSITLRDDAPIIRITDHQLPPLTTAQQLALTVLVGEPDRAVLSALCDCLIEMGHEYAAECYEKGKRDGNPMAEAVKDMTPAVNAYADACRHLVNGLAARLAAPPAVTG